MLRYSNYYLNMYASMTLVCEASRDYTHLCMYRTSISAIIPPYIGYHPSMGLTDTDSSHSSPLLERPGRHSHFDGLVSGYESSLASLIHRDW